MADFTILRPWWFILLLLPLIFIYIDFAKTNKLQNFIREDLINYLRSQNSSKAEAFFESNKKLKSEEISESINERAKKAVVEKPKLWKKYCWLIIPYFFAIFGLSGPAISKEGSLFKNNENWVWVIDSSLSMLANDLEPNRFQRARYSLIELLNASKVNRRIAILAYAGEDYLISPPTDDTTSLLFSLQDLDPTIMPAQGSEPLPALKRAVQILKENDNEETPGNILLVLDDIKSQEEATDLINYINNEVDFPVYIYAVGTSKGAPISVNGQLLQDKNNNMIMANSHLDLIQEVAKATKSKVYYEIGEEAPHLENMYTYAHPKYKKTSKSKYIHQDFGYYFLFVALLTCVCFVKNYFFAIILACGLSLATLHPIDAFAEEETDSAQITQTSNANDNVNFSPTLAESDAVDKPNEYGYQLYQQKKYEEALKYLTDHLWRGNAFYRLERYDKALQEYQLLGNDADAKFNIGNCFAMMKSPKALSDAVIAYDQALELNPNHADASLNKTIITEYLRKLREMASTQKTQQTNLLDESGRIIGQEISHKVTPAAKTTTLLQRRLMLQQRKKNPKVLEQTW